MTKKDGACGGAQLSANFGRAFGETSAAVGLQINSVTLTEGLDLPDGALVPTQEEWRRLRRRIVFEFKALDAPLQPGRIKGVMKFCAEFSLRDMQEAVGFFRTGAELRGVGFPNASLTLAIRIRQFLDGQEKEKAKIESRAKDMPVRMPDVGARLTELKIADFEPATLPDRESCRVLRLAQEKSGVALPFRDLRLAPFGSRAGDQSIEEVTYPRFHGGFPDLNFPSAFQFSVS
ncbi:MAG: hypothetical protein QGH15_21300 [Kiritimatiellia bacterium]|nr:hypothetical protein [Kiritimatiellia bacterium]